MQVDFTYKLAKIFNKDGDNIGEYRGIHFVNHHSLVELYKKQIKIENHHKYFVDGILLSIILKIKGISHDYMPGPIFFEKNLWKLDQDTLFIVSRKKGACTLSSKGWRNISVAPLIEEENSLDYLSTLEFKSNSVVLGIGSPSQDFLAGKITELHPNLQVWCVGAALEFYTGLQKRPPNIFRICKLEWLWRLVTNFSVTWRRIVISTITLIRFMHRGYIR
jgi:exopolysaccharide biosynthesis WecB/TagA/CpsF family protein